MDVYQRRRLVALSAIAALFVIFVLLIRSCGDDEAPVTTTPVSGATLGGAAPTLDSYIQEADAICLQANTLIADLDTSDPQQAAIDQANAVGSELQSVQTLTVPTDAADDVDSVLKALEKYSENLNDRVVAYENGDTTAVAELDIAVEEAQSKFGKKAKRLGLEVCGDPEAVGESTSAGGSGNGGGNDTSATETAPSATESVTPVTPAPTTPAVEPSTEGGTATEPAPPADTGTDSSSGGVSP